MGSCTCPMFNGDSIDSFGQGHFSCCSFWPLLMASAAAASSKGCRRHDNSRDAITVNLAVSNTHANAAAIQF